VQGRRFSSHREPWRLQSNREHATRFSLGIFASFSSKFNERKGSNTRLLTKTCVTRLKSALIMSPSIIVSFLSAERVAANTAAEILGSELTGEIHFIT
jgi:hypothetical protein